MDNQEIEEFGKQVVAFVRDLAIDNSDSCLEQNGRTAQRWKAAKSLSPDQFARIIIPDIVDETLYWLMRAIDEGLLTLSYTASSGKTVNLTEEGLSELAGWYLGRDGWIGTYSKERFVDYGSTPEFDSENPTKQSE